MTLYDLIYPLTGAITGAIIGLVASVYANRKRKRELEQHKMWLLLKTTTNNDTPNR